MKNVAFVLYRQWAYDIFVAIMKKLEDYPSVNVPLLVVTPEVEFTKPESGKFEVLEINGNDDTTLTEVFLKHNIEVAFFYGWSWIVKEPLLSKILCLCLHPSPLPKYRGGSPIQNQIIAGETESAVSIIKMSAGIDDGDIYTQIPFNLRGYLPEIFARMVEAGTEGTQAYLRDMKQGRVTFSPQIGLEDHPPLKRRTPDQSTLTIESLTKMSYEELYNLVRGLQLPYPLVNLKSDAGSLEIETVEFLATQPDGITVYGGEVVDSSKFPLLLKLADGYALVSKGNFIK